MAFTSFHFPKEFADSLLLIPDPWLLGSDTSVKMSDVRLHLFTAVGAGAAGGVCFYCIEINVE